MDVRAPGRYLPSVFDVDGLAVAAVSDALLGAAELTEARGGRRPRVALDARHVACAFASERHIRGAPAAGFAPLSRFAPTHDGWIRLHANFPHHRRALLAALEAPEERALDAIAERDAIELETAIVEAGGAAAAVRSRDQWAAHPQGGVRPLVEWVAVEAPPPRAGERLRVLDLTRVIAGPVATRFLAALSADVLRIDPPHMPDVGVEDTCSGKRLAELDLRHADVEALLADADVVVQGYRPGALAAFGLDAASLAERHPHLVVASLSAWGWDGPWAERRGFDSLVQAASGIAVAEGRDGVPGVLPVQALDHATGYLTAAAVLHELARRWRGEPAAIALLSLAATAAELMRRPGRAGEPPDCEPFRLQLGELSVIAPPGELDGRPLAWGHAVRRGEPRWLA
jgi:hypothetical protein